MTEAKIHKIIKDEINKYGSNVDARIRIAVREIMKQNDCLYISQIWGDVIEENFKPHFEKYPLRKETKSSAKKESNIIQMTH